MQGWRVRIGGKVEDGKIDKGEEIELWKMKGRGFAMK